MNSNVTTSDVLATVGILLTLASLVGTFFYIRLGDMVRDTVALRTRWTLYQYEDDDGGRVGRNECRATLDGLQNPSTLLLIVIPSLSVVVMLAVSLLILMLTRWTELTTVLATMIVIFVIIFCVLTAALYRTAMSNLTETRASVKEYDSKQTANSH